MIRFLKRAWCWYLHSKTMTRDPYGNRKLDCNRCHRWYQRRPAGHWSKS